MGNENQTIKYSWPIFLFLSFLCQSALFPAAEGLIELGFIVTDKNGIFIEGLTKDDFEIYEDGKKQNISDFLIAEIINGKFLIKHSGGEITWKPRTLMVIFAQSTTNPFSLQLIKEPLKKFLKEQFCREDNIYFFTDREAFAWQGQKLIHLGQKLLPLKDDGFKDRFIKEIISNLTQEAVDITFSPEKYAGIPETPDKGWNPRNKPEEYLSDFEVDYKKFTVQNFIERLKAIAKVGEKIEGEKTALLISELPQQNMETPLKSETRTISSYVTGGKFRGKVIDKGKTFMSSHTYPTPLGEFLCHTRTTLYSALLGSVKSNLPQLENTDIIRNTIWEKEEPLSQSLPELGFDSGSGSYQNIIKNLSKETGGVALSKTKNLDETLSQIGQAMKKSYLLSYSSSNPVKDGKFRRIEVKVKKNGLRTRHRKGYYSLNKELEELKEMEKALEKKATSQKLMIFMKTMIIPIENSRSYLLLKIEPRGLTVNDIAWVEDGMIKSRLIARMRLLLQIENEVGKLTETLNKTFDFDIKENQLFIRPAVYFGQELERGKYRAKITLKDQISSEITTQEEVVDTKNLWPWKEGEKNDFQHFLFLKRDSLIKELNEIKEAFVYQGEKLYPRLDEEFKPEENLELYFKVNAEDEKGIDFYFSVINEDNQVFKTYEMSSSLTEKANPFLISIPLKDYSPGSYILQITAVMRESRKYMIARKNFKIII